MVTLETVLPKSNNTFDLSNMNTYEYDEDYQFIGISITYKSVSGNGAEISLYINGKPHWSRRRASELESTVYATTQHTIEGDLSNAVVSARYYDSSTSFPIIATKMTIFKDYVEPSNVFITEADLYVNGYSEIKFRGNKYTTGVKGSVNGGTPFEEQAIPGSLNVIESDFKTTGIIRVPPGCFIVGTNEGRVWSLNHTKAKLEGRDTAYGTGTILPTAVTQFKFDNTKPSKDMPITCTWKASPQQFKYQIKYKPQGGTEVVLEEIATGTQLHPFPTNKLPEGVVTVSVRIFDGVYWSDWVSTNITTYAHKVTVFEPNGVAQNKDSEITATWDSSDPQEQYQFKYKVGDIEQPIISGTTIKKHVFPADTFGVETVDMQVRTYNGYVWSEWKTASFVAFGTPETPVITSPTTFDTAYPVFAWEVVGQTGYNMQVFEGQIEDGLLVYDTGDMVSNVRLHEMTKALGNNKTYTLRLSIKNQYGYNSAYATQTFSIAYEELQKPSFTIFADYINGAHIIDISNVDSEIFKECEVHRKEEGKDWTRIAKGLPKVAQFRDRTPRSNVTYYYKVRAVSTAEGISDSDMKLSYTKLKHAELLNINTDEITVLKSNFKRNVTLEQDMSEKFYAGRETPVANYGEKKYKVVNISFAVKTFKEKELFEELYYSRPTLLYRDNKGEKIYCYISAKPKIIPTKNYWTIEFSVTEQRYEEGV